MPTETQLSKGAFDTSVFNEMFESTAAGVREGIRAQVETKRNEIFDKLRERVKTAASGLHDKKLDAAIDNDMDAPFSCKAGICSTCRAKVLEGDVEMEVNHALEDYEIRAGYVLSCQCIPLSDKVVLSYDE